MHLFQNSKVFVLKFFGFLKKIKFTGAQTNKSAPAANRAIFPMVFPCKVNPTPAKILMKKKF